MYMCNLRDTLTCLKPVSLEGQEEVVCAGRISFTVDNVKQDIEALLQKKGPYTQTFLASAVVDKEARTVYLNDELLSNDRASEAWLSSKRLREAMLTEISQRYQNPTFLSMAVADCRCWTSATVTHREKTLVGCVEERWGSLVPDIVGSWEHFGKAKAVFFASNKEDQEAACTTRGCFKLWCAMAGNKRFALSLRLFAPIIVLACPSSADAERAISTLNSIATTLRSVMS